MPHDDLLSQLTFRPYNLDDRPFVLASFESSYWSSDAHRGLRGSDFHRLVVVPFESLLKRFPPTLAVFNDDASDCAGWSLSSPEALFYVYVKPRYRKRGLGSALLARAPRPLTLVFLTADMRRLLRSHEIGYSLSPYLLLV